MVKIVKFLNLDEGEQKFDIAYPFTQSVPLKEYKIKDGTSCITQRRYQQHHVVSRGAIGRTASVISVVEAIL